MGCGNRRKAKRGGHKEGKTERVEERGSPRTGDTGTRSARHATNVHGPTRPGSGPVTRPGRGTGRMPAGERRARGTGARRGGAACVGDRSGGVGAQRLRAHCWVALPASPPPPWSSA